MRQVNDERVPLTIFSIAARLNRLPITKTHREATAIIGAGIFFDLYEVFLTGILGVVLARRPGVGPMTVPFLISALFVGACIGSAGLTALADRLGRRQAFVLSMLIYSAASLATSFSQDTAFLIVTRLVAGVGIGAELPVADSYLADLLPEQYRGRYTAWAYTIGFAGIPVAAVLGQLLAKTVSLDTTCRLLFIGGSFGALVVAVRRRRLPESPRWLEATGRRDEAAGLVTAMESQAAGRGWVGAPRCDIAPHPHVSYGSLLRSPLLGRTVMLAVFQLSQGIGYYGFGMLAPTILLGRGYSIVTSLGFAAAFYAGYPAGSLLSLRLIDCMERKHIIAWSGAFIAVIGVGFSAAGESIFILVAGFLYTFFSGIFSNAYHIYQSELFPTRIRAMTVGVSYSLSRLSVAAMPLLLIPVLRVFGPTVLFAVIGTLMAVAAVTVAVLGPRTTRRPLETISHGG